MHWIISLLYSICRLLHVLPSWQLRSTTNGTTTPQATGHIHLHYMINHLFVLLSSNSHGSRKLPDDGRLLPKHVEACILNKEVI
jgi:hypothetical protein